MSERTTLRRLSPRSLVPNLLTLAALCFGLTAIRFCLDSEFVQAAICLALAGTLDAFDGRVARLLRSESLIGAQLDSLADFLNFGVASGFLVYLWGLQDMGRAAWLVILIYVACCALRLARYNIALDDDTRPAWKSRFFSGIPSPAAAGLILLPVSFHLAGWIDLRAVPVILLANVLLVGLLMITPLPTPSFRLLPHVMPFKSPLPIMLMVVAFISALLTFPWATLNIIGFLYIVSIPVGVFIYRRMSA